MSRTDKPRGERNTLEVWSSRILFAPYPHAFRALIFGSSSRGVLEPAGSFISEDVEFDGARISRGHLCSTCSVKLSAPT